MANFYPEDYGAAGNGTTNDTASLQSCVNAATAAAGTVVLRSGKTFATTARLVIPNGLAGFSGPGAMKALTGSTSFGLYLKGVADGAATNVKNLTITGVTFNANGVTAQGLLALNSSGITLSNCTFSAFVPSGQVVNFFAARTGQENSTGIHITNNTVTMAAGTVQPACIGIALGGDSSYLPKDYWFAEHKAVPPAFVATDSYVNGNTVTGGYYGISLSVATNFQIVGNTVTGQQRNISIQNGCSNFEVSSNNLSESISCAVLMSFGCKLGVVKNNTCTTSTAAGGGLFQAYWGPKNIQFINNTAAVTGNGFVNFFFYIGVNAADCSIINNRATGKVAKAFIGVDSDWSSSNSPVSNYNYNGPADDNYPAGGTDADSSNTVIRGNVLKMASVTPYPAIFLDQLSHTVDGSAVVRKLTDVQIRDNRVLNSDFPSYLTLNQDTAGALSPVDYTYNFWLANTPSSKITPGTATFRKRWENAEDARPYGIGTLTNAQPSMRLVRTGGDGDLSGFVSSNSVDASHDPEASFIWRSGWDCGVGFTSAPTTGQLPDTKYVLRVNPAGNVFLFINGDFYGLILNNAVSNGDKIAVRYVRATGAFQVYVNGTFATSVALGGGALTGPLYLDVPILSGAIDLLYFGNAGGVGNAYPGIGGMIYETDTLAGTRNGGSGSWAAGFLSSNSVPGNQDPEAVIRWFTGSAVGFGFTNSASSTGRLNDTDYVFYVDGSGNLYFFINGSFYTSFGGYTATNGGTLKLRYIRSEAKLHMYSNDVEIVGQNAPIYIGVGALAGPIYLGCPIDTGTAAVEYFGPRR